MFDIGFWELAVIGIVALLVIGPDKLPSVARTTGLWVGRIRRMISNVKDDISKELKAEELKRIMEEQKSSNAIHEFIEETKSELSINNSGETNKPQDSGSTNDGR